MSRKRILIFSTAYLPFVGGAEIAVKEITDRLSNDFEFHLITARLKRNLKSVEKIGAITVHRIGIGIPLLDKFFLPYCGAWETLRLNKKEHFIAFWCIMVTFASGAAYISNWFQKKVPTVLTLQEGDSENWLRYRWLGLLDLSWRLAFRYADFLTAISTYLLNRSRRLGYKGKAELIPNGVDIKRFENKNYQPRNSINTLVTTSRLVEKNAIGDIIEALKFLPPSIRLKIVGTGKLESTLRAKVEKSDLKDRVEFMGAVPNTELPKYLHEADVFIRPSLSEGQGISFIEAMAAGLPVIATPVGGIPDFLKDTETGLFCEVNNPQSIAKQVKRLINDVDLRLRLAENAMQMVTERYDWNLIAEKMKRQVFDLPAGRQVR